MEAIICRERCEARQQAGKRRSGRIRPQNIARTFGVLPPRGEQEILDLVDLLRLRREAGGRGGEGTVRERQLDARGGDFAGCAGE